MTSRRTRFFSSGALLVATLALAGILSADTAHDTALPRPIALGTSGGNINDSNAFSCCGGTLGSLVTDGASQFILSNNHVFARSNKGSVGDGIIQPGLIDESPVCAANSADVVANLSAWAPLQFRNPSNPQATNTVDAAIAQVVPDKVQSDGSILGIGTISSTPVAAEIGMGVQKSGRTTGLTSGAVAAVSVTVQVRYGGCGSGRGLAMFTDQIRITPGGFSAGGDSGSLIVDDSTPPRAVGLLFAGSDSDTIANPIQSVLAALGVNMVGTGSSSGRAPFMRWLGSVLGWPAAAHAAGGGARSVDPAWLAAAREVKQRHEGAMMQIPGVVGLGVGAADGAPGVAAIEVYVERDTPALRRAIGTQLEGIPVKVVETGEITARAGTCFTRPSAEP